MSSATDLTKAWLESLPTDVDEPTPATRIPHRSTESRTHNARDEDALALSSSASVSVHPLRRSQSRGDANGHVKRHLAKVSTSAHSMFGVAGGGGRGGRIETSKNTDDDAFSDVDKAFYKLLDDFSVPCETAEVGKKTRAETASYTPPSQQEDSGGDRKTSNYLWIRPTVITARTGQRKLPVIDGRNQSTTRSEISEVDELAEELVRQEREETRSRRSERNTRNQRNNSMSPSSRGPVKAFYDYNYKPQDFSTQTLTVSESNAIKDSAFRKPSLRHSAASSTDRTYQSSRDFATQTFGQMVTTSTANSEAQTEISAATNKPDDVMLKNSLMNYNREAYEEYLSRHSLGGVNDVSDCRTNSSKSLHRSVETSKKSNRRLLNESFDDSIEKWSKKENPVVGSDRFKVNSSKGTPAADTVSVKSRSLSDASNSRRLMSLMLEEVKALKSFVQAHLDERQTTTNRTPTKQRLEEKDPDSDSAVELRIVDKTHKERERSKHRSRKSSKSGRRHSRHRRTEDEENEEGYRRRRRQSPTREGTWDDIRRGPSVDDSRNPYFSMVDGRRQYVEPADASSSVYNTFPHSDNNRPIHPSAYQTFIPAPGVTPTFYQSPFQLYQNRNVVNPFHGFGQPPTMLPTYQAPDLANRFGGYAPMNTQPLMYNTMPADQAYPLQVPVPNSVAMVPAVEPTAYQVTTVRPALTFIPACVTPMGPPIQSTQGVWRPQGGQFTTRDSEARNPNNGGLVSNERDNVRARRNEPSTRNSFRSDHQPRKLMNSLNEALKEAQGIRHLTERLGKDTQLTSY